MNRNLKIALVNLFILLVVWAVGLQGYKDWRFAQALDTCQQTLRYYEERLEETQYSYDRCEMEMDECMAVSRECEVPSSPTPEEVNEVLRVHTSNR